jgi:hypothetical protein
MRRRQSQSKEAQGRCLHREQGERCHCFANAEFWPLLTVSLSFHSQWFSVLSQVHASTDQEIREMHDEQANPQNAVVRKHWLGWRRKEVRMGKGQDWGFLDNLLFFK